MHCRLPAATESMYLQLACICILQLVDTHGPLGRKGFQLACSHEATIMRTGRPGCEHPSMAVQTVALLRRSLQLYMQVRSLQLGR